MVPLALDMACKLFVELCGGEVSVATIDVRSRTPSRRRSCGCGPTGWPRCLATDVPAAEITGILSRLGCSVSSPGPDLVVEIPSFRADLEREIDLIEEVARVLRPRPHPGDATAQAGGERRPRPGLRRPGVLVEDLLVGAGLTQVINYSFGDDKWPELLRLPADDAGGAGRCASPTL